MARTVNDGSRASALVRDLRDAKARAARRDADELAVAEGLADAVEDGLVTVLSPAAR